jgi:hypothetical protein
MMEAKKECEFAGACSATAPGDGRNIQVTSSTKPWHDLQALPGKFVMSFENSDPGYLKGHNLEFCVKRVEPSSQDDHNGTPYYSASIPYRCIVCIGDTADEAISSLLHYVADMARTGALDPNNPSEYGDPPIQHAIGILTERLLWQVERRHEHLGRADADIVWAERTPDEKAAKEQQEMYLSYVSRDNEVISALATSIAALARVKDL